MNIKRIGRDQEECRFVRHTHTVITRHISLKLWLYTHIYRQVAFFGLPLLTLRSFAMRATNTDTRSRDRPEGFRFQQNIHMRSVWLRHWIFFFVIAMQTSKWENTKKKRSNKPKSSAKSLTKSINVCLGCSRSLIKLLYMLYLADLANASGKQWQLPLPNRLILILNSVDWLESSLESKIYSFDIQTWATSPKIIDYVLPHRPGRYIQATSKCSTLTHDRIAWRHACMAFFGFTIFWLVPFTHAHVLLFSFAQWIGG